MDGMVAGGKAVAHYEEEQVWFDFHFCIDIYFLV